MRWSKDRHAHRLYRERRRGSFDTLGRIARCRGWEAGILVLRHEQDGTGGLLKTGTRKLGRIVRLRDDGKGPAGSTAPGFGPRAGLSSVES